MRAHVAEYQRIVCTSITTDDTTHQDLVGKAGTLLVYDFEAAMSLSQFDDLQDIIQVAKPYKDVLAYKAMGNLLLQSPIPVESTSPFPLFSILKTKQIQSSKLP